MSNVAWQMREVITKAVRDSELKFKQDNETALGYKVIPAFRVVRKASPAFFDQPIVIVRNFLESKSFLHSTNEQIMETVANRLAPERVPSNYMDKPLSPKQLRAIAAIMAGAGLAFDPKVQKSLSKIKLVIQAGKAAADAELSFTGKITFGHRCVTVGTKRYPVATDAKGYRRIKVGSQKLRVDVLQALVEAGNLPSSTL